MSCALQQLYMHLYLCIWFRPCCSINVSNDKDNNDKTYRNSYNIINNNNHGGCDSEWPSVRGLL